MGEDQQDSRTQNSEEGSEILVREGAALFAITTDLDAYERQMSVERRFRDEVIEVQTDKFDKASRAKRATIDERLAIMTDLVPRLAKAIEDSQEGKPGRADALKPVLKKLGSKTIAAITVQLMIVAASEKMSVQEAGSRIGELLAEEVRARKVDRLAKKEWSKRDKSKRSDANRLEYWSLVGKIKQALDADAGKEERLGSEQGQVGLPLVFLAADRSLTDVFEIIDYEFDVSEVGFSDEAVGKRNGLIAQSAARVRADRQPMLVVPRSWTKSDDGGFLTVGSRCVNRRPMAKWTKPYWEMLDRQPLREPLAVLNHLQSTAWTVDRRMQQMMREMFGAEGVQRARSGKRKRQKRERIDDLHLLMGEADLLRERLGEQFFYVWRYDFRGRAYPRGRVLTPQGRDEALALLRFADSKPLGEDGVKWLAICGSNELPNVRGDLKGQDSLEGRVRWIEQNTSRIRAAAKDPAKHVEFWSGAQRGADGKVNLRDFSKTAWQALRFCIEWDDHHTHGRKFSSSLPVAIDGTCNALQHFAALSRDRKLAADVNLTKTEFKQDIYGKVGEVLPNVVVRGNNLFLLALLAEMGLSLETLATRNFCKIPVMTMPYGASLSTVSDEIMDFLEDEYPDEWNKAMDGSWRMAKDGVRQLAGFMDEAVNREASAAVELKEWFRECASLMTEVQEPLVWQTASGWPVWQIDPTEKDTRCPVGARYINKKWRNRVKAVRRFTLKQYLEPLDDKDAMNGVTANFVHSVDASHMMKCTLRARREGIDSLRMVHDSFGTHASNMEALGRIVRDSFVEMYSDGFDPIESFIEHCNVTLQRHGQQPLPDRPAKGSFDVAETRDSLYFFS